jgi:hypothetical protein
MAETIIIRTASPKDITFEEAEEIATLVRSLNATWEVKVEHQELSTSLN